MYGSSLHKWLEGGGGGRRGGQWLVTPRAEEEEEQEEEQEEGEKEEEKDFAQRPLHQAKNTSFEEKKLFENFLVKSNTFSSYWKFVY